MSIAIDPQPSQEIISILRMQRTRLVPPRGDGYYRSRLENNVPVTMTLDGSVIGYAALEQRLDPMVGVAEFYLRQGCRRYLTDAWEALRREIHPAYLLIRTDDPITTLLAFQLGLAVGSGALYMERETAVRLEGRPGLELRPLSAETFDAAFAILQPESPWNGGHTEEEREPMRASIGTDRYHVLLLDGKVVGVGMLNEEEQGVLDIGMVIHREYRRQGLAAYMLSNLASDMEARGYRLTAGLDSNNTGSRRALEKAGFQVVYAWSTPPLEQR